MKSLLTGFLVIAASVLLPAAHAVDGAGQARVMAAVAAATAHEAVEIATAEVLDLIRAASYAEADPDRFHAEVEALLRPIIDFPRFARGVMGPYSKRASQEQRDRFAESFKWSLVRTYAMALTEFKDGKVEVRPSSRKSSNPNKADVAMTVNLQGKAYAAIYRMQRRDDQWKVYNLVIEGVNIGISYRSQFAQAMQDPQYGGELDTVIEAWTRVAQEPTADSAAEDLEDE